MEELIKEITTRKELANKHYKDNAKISINAYGTGYELGYGDALVELLEFIKDIEDEN